VEFMLLDGRRVTVDEDLVDGHQARYSFDRLLIEQPDLRDLTLWKIGLDFFVLYPELSEESVAKNGQNLVEWFDYSCRPVATSMRIVATVPEEALQIPVRTAEEVACLVDDPTTIRELYTSLNLLLPRDFPLFKIETEPALRTTIVTVPRQLSDEEIEQVSKAYESIRFYFKLDVKVDPTISENPPPFRISTPGTSDLDLIPSRLIAATCPQSIVDLYEEDEEFWLENRSKLASSEFRLEGILPNQFLSLDSSCLIPSEIPVDVGNIRSYLPLYKRIAVMMPLFADLPRFLGNLCMTEEDFFWLAENGRLQILMPQSIDRYNISFVAELASRAPQSMLLSRRLALGAVFDIRRRFPLFFPPMNSIQKSEILRFFGGIERRIEGRNKLLLKALMDELTRIWLNAEGMINYRGAMAIPFLNYSSVVAKYLELAHNSQVSFEATIVSSPVVYAGLLGATLCIPENHGVYTARNLKSISSMHSGIPMDEIPRTYNMSSILSGLNVLDNDASIHDVASTFRGDIPDRIRRVALDMSSSADEVQTLVDELNEKVLRYERRISRLRHADWIGLAPVFMQTEMGSIGSGWPVSLGFWLLSHIISHDNTRLAPDSIAELIRGAATWSPRDAVFLSKLRD